MKLKIPGVTKREMNNSISINEAVTRALTVVEYFADAAIARIREETVTPLAGDLAETARRLASIPGTATGEERLATRKSAGVQHREMECLKTAPGLPQSLIHAGLQASGQARAETLGAVAIWRLAGCGAANSSRAAQRAVRFNEWVRSNFLLIEGPLPMEPQDLRALWTIVYGEARTAKIDGVANIATLAASAAPTSSFAGALMCCEHAARLAVPSQDEDHPIRQIPLAATPRFGHHIADTTSVSVPPDFEAYLYSNS